MTLTNLIADLRTRLADSGSSKWSDAELEEAIAISLSEFSAHCPREKIGTISITSPGREIDISALSDLLEVQRVWWDYDSTDPAYPPRFRDFEIWDDDTLFIRSPLEPDSGDTVRVFYVALHTIQNLNGATSTSVPDNHRDTILTGAAYYAAQWRAIKLSETVPAHEDVVGDIFKFADSQRRRFDYLLKKAAATQMPTSIPSPHVTEWGDQDWA